MARVGRTGEWVTTISGGWSAECSNSTRFEKVVEKARRDGDSA